MRKSLKIVAVAAVLFVALGAAAFVYACSQNGANANTHEQQVGVQGIQTFLQSHNITLPDNATIPWGYNMRKPKVGANGPYLTEEFLQNATISNVTGTVVLEVKRMLVLDTSSGQVRILLPKDWIVGNETMNRVTLFNGTFTSQGQSITITVLESNVFANANFSINEMIGYEAINATGTHAYAVLPFNIQPAS